MKTARSKLVGCSCILFLTAWALAPRASAQTRPSLGLQFTAGQPTLSLTGAVGVVYSIQYATDLSASNGWTDRALFQVRGTNDVWTDPSDPAPSQRFYRTVSVPPPADTNLVFIQPGTFMMGSPTNEPERQPNETQHWVTISRGFWMGKYLVTQGDYLAVRGFNPSEFQPPAYTLDLTRPVETVSWADAEYYCELRTQQEQAAGVIPTNYVYRLPTEAEWEYACRAGTTTAFYLGCDLHSGQANFYDKSEYDCSVGSIYNPSGIEIDLAMTTPVGSYAPNPWGLYDMIGNVIEWCLDGGFYDYPTGPVTDPQGPTNGRGRVLRSGGFLNGAESCRSASRGGADITVALRNIGFRVVLAQAQP